MNLSSLNGKLIAIEQNLSTYVVCIRLHWTLETDHISTMKETRKNKSNLEFRDAYNIILKMYILILHFQFMYNLLNYLSIY